MFQHVRIYRGCRGNVFGGRHRLTPISDHHINQLGIQLSRVLDMIRSTDGPVEEGYGLLIERVEGGGSTLTALQMSPSVVRVDFGEGWGQTATKVERTEGAPPALAWPPRVRPSAQLVWV